MDTLTQSCRAAVTDDCPGAPGIIKKTTEGDLSSGLSIDRLLGLKSMSSRLSDSGQLINLANFMPQDSE